MRRTTNFKFIEDQSLKLAQQVLSKAEEEGSYLPTYVMIWPSFQPGKVVVLMPGVGLPIGIKPEQLANVLPTYVDIENARALTVAHPEKSYLTYHDIFRVLIIDFFSSVEHRLILKDSYTPEDHVVRKPPADDPFVTSCHPILVANVAAFN